MTSRSRLVTAAGWTFVILPIAAATQSLHSLLAHRDGMLFGAHQAVFSFALSAAVLASAVGLLRRRELGRRIPILLLSAIIAWNAWLPVYIRLAYGTPLRSLRLLLFVDALTSLLFGSVIFLLCGKSVRKEYQ